MLKLKLSFFWTCVVVAYVILLMVATALNLFGAPTEIFGEKYGYGTILFYALLLYTVASLRIIGPTELGCVLIFGNPWLNVFSGIVFVPLGICELVTETRNTIQDELPAEPEKIYRGSAEDPDGISMPPELQALGMRPPIRVTFSGRNAESVSREIDEDDPYDQRLTEEVVPIIRWRIDDYVKFLKTVGSIGIAREQMEDTCTATFTEHLTKVTPAVALLRLNDYSGILKTAVETLVKDWGVHIQNAQIKAIRFSKALNTAVQNVVVQELNRKATALEGRGLGEKEQAILDGRTAGFGNMKNRLEVDGEVVIGAETARAIAGEGDKSSQRTIIAGSGGFADLIGTAVAIGESLKQKQGDGQ